MWCSDLKPNPNFETPADLSIHRFQIGIKTLRWQFYIIWVVLNGSFVPFTYFL